MAEQVGSGFSIRRNVSNFNDVNYNFQQIWRVMMGNLGTANLLDGAVTGEIIADAAIQTAHIGTAVITDAQIQSLSADKITAGTISASVEMTSATITGGKVRTSASGGRLEMTLNGLIAYRSNESKALSIEPSGFGLDTAFISFFNKQGYSAGQIGLYDNDPENPGGYFILEDTNQTVLTQITCHFSNLDILSDKNITIQSTSSSSHIDITAYNIIMQCWTDLSIAVNNDISINAADKLDINADRASVDMDTNLWLSSGVYSWLRSEGTVEVVAPIIHINPGSYLQIGTEYGATGIVNVGASTLIITHGLITAIT